MMKKSVYKEIEEAKQKRADNLAALKNSLEKCEEDKRQAEADAAEALTAGNADAYARAKEKGRSAADKIEFYNIQIENAEKGALFEAGEKAEKIAAITASVDDVKAAKLKEAAQLLISAAALVDDVRAEIVKANAAFAAIGSKKKMDIASISGLNNSLNAAKNHAEIQPFIK